MKIWEINSREEQEEALLKEDIARFLSEPLTRKEAFEFMVNITARVELLEIDNLGSTDQKAERMRVNQDYISNRSKELFEKFCQAAPRTTLL